MEHACCFPFVFVLTVIKHVLRALFVCVIASLMEIYRNVTCAPGEMCGQVSNDVTFGKHNSLLMVVGHKKEFSHSIVSHVL